MATETTNLGLNIDGEDDFYDIERVNRNWEKIDAAVTDVSEMKTAGGTGTAITLSIPSLAAYKANQKFSFIASANNSGASTTINVNGLGAKSLFKANTTTAPKLVAGKAYEVWYNGTSFFLKASAEGNAIAAEVLAGKTFSNDDDTGIVGIIPSKGAATITPGTANQTIAAGQYLSGAQTIEGDADLVASNIKAGANIFGVDGVYEGENPLKTWKNKGNVIYCLGDKYEDSLLKFYGRYASLPAEKLRVTGKGWINGLSTLSEGVRLVVDGEAAIDNKSIGSSVPIMTRFKEGFILYSAPDPGTDISYVLD